MSAQAAGALIIGRDPRADFIVRHLQVSWQHAVISVDERQRQVVRDLSSTHGTFVNGERVLAPRVLCVGDRIGVGPCVLRYDGERVSRDEARGVALAVRGLTRLVRGHTTVLDGVSFDVRAGELTVLAGQSGAGKTSVLRALLDLDVARCAALTVNGVAYPQLPEWLRPLVGYVAQENPLPAALSLERALYYVGRLRAARDVRADEINRRIAGLLRQVRLWEQRAQRVRTLSTGELRRAQVVAELICAPPLLLLDEPTSGIDPHARLELVELLRELARQGTTILMASHDTRELEIADTLVMLARGGRLAYCGLPATALAGFGATAYEAIYAQLAATPSPCIIEEAATPDAIPDAIPDATPDAIPSSAPDVSVAPPPPPPSPFSMSTVRALARVAPAHALARGRAFAYQLGVLLRQYRETVFADSWHLAFLLIQAPVIALMVALVCQDYAFVLGNGPFEAQKTLFLMLVAAVWFGIINAIREISKERHWLRRQRIAGLSIGAYVVSKVVVLGGLCLGQSAILALIVLGKTGLPPASASLYLPVAVEVYISIALAGIAGVALGLLLSAAGGTTDRVMSLAPLILLPQILFAGVIFVVSGPVQVPADVTVAYWAMRAAGSSVDLDHLYYEQLISIYPVLRDHPGLEHSPILAQVPPFRPQDYDAAPTLRHYASILTFEAAWNDARATRRANLATCWIMLASLIVGFSLLTWLCLRIRAPAVARWWSAIARAPGMALAAPLVRMVRVMKQTALAAREPTEPGDPRFG